MNRPSMMALVAGTAALMAIAACRTVPLTGRTQLLLLSEGEELSMGATAYDQAIGTAKLSKDKEANDQVRRVGQRIAEASGRDDYEWEFKVIANDEQANAFCLPGGKIAVYTGILQHTKSDAGLAVVLGHEVAHALIRHGGERVSQGILASAGTAAVAKALGQGDPGTVKAISAALGIGLTVGVLMPFSRTHESEADRVGLTLMAKAGYRPEEAVGFWKRMAKAGGAGGPEFLSTHPSHSTRIAQIEGWLPEANESYRAP